MIHVYQLDVLGKETKSQIKSLNVQRTFNGIGELEDFRKTVSGKMEHRYGIKIEICFRYCEK